LLMSENVPVGKLTEEEIERLANSRAEKDAFIKSTIVFALVLLGGFLLMAYRLVKFDQVLYLIILILFASVVAALTRWLVKESAYEKYYAIYKEQQEQGG